MTQNCSRTHSKASSYKTENDIKENRYITRLEMISTWKPNVEQLVVFWQGASNKLGSKDASFFSGAVQTRLTAMKVSFWQMKKCSLLKTFFNKRNDKNCSLVGVGASQKMLELKQKCTSRIIYKAWWSCKAVLPSMESILDLPAKRCKNTRKKPPSGVLKTLFLGT